MSNNNELKKQEKAWYVDSLRLFTRLSVWIAIPVVVASLAGNYLDEKYNTAPWLLLFCVGMSFILSMIILVKETMKEFDRQDEEKEKLKLEK